MILVTKGRLGGEYLSAHLEVSSLPILMPQRRAAYLYMIRAHCGEHGTEHKMLWKLLLGAERVFGSIEEETWPRRSVQGVYIASQRRRC